MYEKYQIAIEKKLAEINLPKKPENLYNPIRYFLSLGGKRMRPVLLMMAHEMFGGKAENTIAPATAIELFHNFSLVHDDIMDKASLRRGQATVHEKWNADIAILSGDALLIEAYKLLAECDGRYLKQVLAIFNKTSVEVCEGQIMDMDFEKRNNVSIDEYIDMIRLKTAVLLGGSLKIGAVLAGANEKDAEAIYHFGVHLGIAFQLQDDILDAYGDPKKFGKTVGGDIAANKKTFLLLKTKELASETDKKHLENLMHIFHHDKIEQVMKMYDAYHVKNIAEGEMQNHFQTAMNNLQAIAVTNELKKPLTELAGFLMQRES
jgi:geranylgeranyl diphosphate synthase type II